MAVGIRTDNSTGDYVQAPSIEGPGPFLYVGGFKISMYELGSSRPLHVTNVNPPVYRVAIALDLHGHLCEANGEITYAQLFAYRAAGVPGGFMTPGT